MMARKPALSQERLPLDCRNANIFDATVAVDVERDGRSGAWWSCERRVDGQAIPVGIDATLGGLDVPAEASGEVAAALAWQR